MTVASALTGFHSPCANATLSHNLVTHALRSYFCVTTNLSKGDPAVHRAGPLWLLVRASMTIVGLVPPVFYEGDLLIDGGWASHFSVSTCVCTLALWSEHVLTVLCALLSVCVALDGRYIKNIPVDVMHAQGRGRHTCKDCVAFA